MEQKINKKIGFCIDIDGTVVLGKTALPYAKQSLDSLNQKDIPFIFLTNNIATSEQQKAQQLNSILKLKKPIIDKQIVLSTTPFQSYYNSFNDKIVLVIGRQQRLKDILPFQYMQKYITIQQYCTIFPQTVPLSKRPQCKGNNEVLIQVKKRLNLQNIDKFELQFSAIMILTTPLRWEECYQVIIDILNTQNGSISKENTYQNNKNHIPILVAYNDIFHISKDHHLPRLLMKPFTQGLKAVFKLVYNQQLKLQIFGKPQISVFQFTKKRLEQIHGPIQKMIMIGDNDHSDILGAFNAKWDSILVKTGVSKQDSQMATINSENIKYGIEQYLKMINYQ